MNKTRKTVTIVGWVLLVLTVLSVGTEVYGAAFVRDSNTDTWTEFIVEWVPWELSLAVYGALAIWVPIHFYVNYRRKLKREEEEKIKRIEEAFEIVRQRDNISIEEWKTRRKTSFYDIENDI